MPNDGMCAPPDGDHPRAFNFDPTGNFFYCSKLVDAITAFRVDRRTGALIFSGNALLPEGPLRNALQRLLLLAWVQAGV
jgi:6-phosphogluconolactonase (cycloisomerase 2 family)